MSGRIRSIKPELLDDEVAASLSDPAWRLWVSSWVLADDHGNFRAGERYLAASVWQDTSKDALPALRELVQKGRVSVYLVNGQRYAHIAGWDKHQRIDNAGKHRVPPQNSPGSTTDQALTEDLANSRESLGILPLDHRPPTTTPEQRPPTVDHVVSKETTDSVRMVYEYFVEVWKKTFSGRRSPILDRKRKAAVRARIAEGFSVEDLKTAIDGIFTSPFHLGQNDRGKKYIDLELICRDAKHVEEYSALAAEQVASAAHDRPGGPTDPDEALGPRVPPPKDFLERFERLAAATAPRFRKPLPGEVEQTLPFTGTKADE